MQKEIIKKKIEEFLDRYDHLWFLPDLNSISYSQDEIVYLFKILFEKEKEFDFARPVYYRIDEQLYGKWGREEQGNPKLNNKKQIILDLGDCISCQYIDNIIIFTTKEGNLGIKYAKGSVSTSKDDFYGVAIFPKKSINNKKKV